MHLDIKARGFVLTPALAAKVRCEAAALADRLDGRRVWMQVRLFDINGSRGGIDKGCLVTASLDRRKRLFVATSVDRDLYAAIPAAFDKLIGRIFGATRRARTLRRRAITPVVNYVN